MIANANLLRPEVVEGDALVHQYWMRSFADPSLFTDPLTALLRDSERYPAGYQALLWLASQVTDPIRFGEWLGVGLMSLAGWLVYRIVREQAAWRPAAWIGAALFLALDGHRFYGGFPRAFVQVVVLLVVLLALRGRHLLAAAAAGAGVLVYPPAALLAVGVLTVSTLGWSAGRPRVDPRRARFALLALALVIAGVLGEHWLSGASFDVMTGSQARRYPEFGSHGGLHFFVSSPIEYLRQNRSGFDLKASGSVLGLAAVALLVVRPGNLRLLRPEVLAMPVAALSAFAMAQALLFRLYLPHRYTYPLVAFFAIAVAVVIRPTWQALWAAPHPRLRAVALLLAPGAIVFFAAHVFPLGPVLPFESLFSWTRAAIVTAAAMAAVGGALMLHRAPGPHRAAVGALLSGLTLVGFVAGAPGRGPPGQSCPASPVMAHFATLAKDAIVAGDPIGLKCVPVTARRAVVITTQIAPSYEASYFLAARARMFAMLRAYYGPSRAAIVQLNARYGATDLWIRPKSIAHEQREPHGVRWHPWQLPYGRFVRNRLKHDEPASLHLPTSCRRFKQGADEVYDIGCIATSRPYRSPRGPDELGTVRGARRAAAGVGTRSPE